MPNSVKVYMKDGSIRDFPHHGRAGGSYSKSVNYIGAVVVIEDEWGKRTAIPVQDVREVVEEPGYAGW